MSMVRCSCTDMGRLRGKSGWKEIDKNREEGKKVESMLKEIPFLNPL